MKQFLFRVVASQRTTKEVEKWLFDGGVWGWSGTCELGGGKEDGGEEAGKVGGVGDHGGWE